MARAVEHRRAPAVSGAHVGECGVDAPCGRARDTAPAGLDIAGDPPDDDHEPAHPSTGPTTLHDIARAAGVSVSTASRVLNGSARKVSGEYWKRVDRAAMTLGYTANLLAQATARGSSATVALLVADIADPYFGQIAAGVVRGADEEGLVVTVAITERDPIREARLVRLMRGQRPRALILAASRTAEPMDTGMRGDLEAVTNEGGRVVTLGSSYPGSRTVRIDNRAGAEALGRAVGARGYRSAVILAAEPGVVASDERVAGFCDGFALAGGVVARIHRGGFTRESGSELMERALEHGLEPGTLVFAVSDVVAVGAFAAAHRAGREIGSDIALCGFDDIPAGRDVTPPLSTVRVPLEEFGYRALHAAIDAEWNPGAAPLALEVVLRESTPAR